MIKTDSKSKLVKKMSEGWSPCPKRLFCGLYYIIVLLSYYYYIVFRICDVGSQFNNGTCKGKVLLTRQLNIYQVRKALLQIKLSQNTRGSVKSCNHWEKRKTTLREKCSYSELFWCAFSRIWTEYGEILWVRTLFTPCKSGKF